MNKYSLMQPGGSRKRYARTAPRVRKTVRKRKISPKLIRRTVRAVKFCILLSALAWGGMYGLRWIKSRFLSNQVLTIKNITTQGNIQLSQSNLMNLIGVDLGDRMTGVSVKTIEARLLSHPWIATADVQRLFPSTLKIRVTEKSPVAAFRMTRKKRHYWYGLSEKGQRLPFLDWVKYDLPIVEVTRNQKDSSLMQICGFLLEAKKSFPGIYHSISQIQSRPNNELICFSREGGHRVRLSLEETYKDTLYIWKLLFNKYREAINKGRTIDLRVRGYAYLS